MLTWADAVAGRASKASITSTIREVGAEWGTTPGRLTFEKIRKLNSTGMRNRVSAVEVTIPPMITNAKGRWVSDPMPCETAAGTRPSPASKAVMSRARSRMLTPLRMSSLIVIGSSSCCNCRKVATRSTPFSTV